MDSTRSKRNQLSLQTRIRGVLTSNGPVSGQRPGTTQEAADMRNITANRLTERVRRLWAGSVPGSASCSARTPAPEPIPAR